MMQNENWAGWGIRITISYFEKLVTAVIRIMGGIGLSASLFISQVPADSGRFIMLNHPSFLLVMVVAMIGAAVLSPVCANKGRQYWGRCAPAARQGNRCFGFYGFMHEDRKRALDLRMYRQQENICSLYMQRDNSFGPTAELAACAKGPMGLWHALSQSIQAVLTGIVYLFVCLKGWAGAFGAGSVTQYVGAIMNIFSGISDLLETLGTIYINAGFLGESFEFLDIPNKMYQGSLTTEKRADRQYQIEFRNVSFQYPGTDVWALRHVSMKFQVGSRLAVVGRNGSGKTTFIKLLCRLYDPTEGQILLNGIDIRKYRYDDYINIFSVVFQDFQLFSMPLGQNVAGKTKYDRTKVIDCLKKAGFAERLETMPDGLDTCLYKELEKEGVEISGGEAQKIAIARALYKDAPFIILDEPTAALDPVAEAEIYSKSNRAPTMNWY